MEGKRRISLMLAVGIVLMPIIFSWATLRDGYSTTIRVISVVWMVLIFMAVAAAPSDESTSSSSNAGPAPAVKPADTDDVDTKIDAIDAKQVEDVEQDNQVKPAKAGDCITDACISDKYLVDATIACKPEIERLAQYDIEWLDGFLTPWAKRFVVSDENRSVITYFGDSVKLQNGFGAWQNMIFMCIYDAESDSVVDVAVEPGRL